VTLQAKDGCLGPIHEAELGKDARDVALHRFLADRERAGYLSSRPQATSVGTSRSWAS
jgi:hypothetical protein